MNAARRYSQAQAATASPERTMVLLFEAALRHIRGGAAALEGGRPADAGAALARASEIVAHLDATFDGARSPEFAGDLGRIYRFVCQRLLSASLHRDPVLAREAERALSPIADGFAAAVRRLIDARGEAGR
jgi:flagellar protein FliS